MYVLGGLIALLLVGAGVILLKAGRVEGVVAFIAAGGLSVVLFGYFWLARWVGYKAVERR